EDKWTEGESHLQEALAILGKFGVPLCAWRVHNTAWKLFEKRDDSAAAEGHRAQAEAGIRQIANSFSPDEPLQAIFLSAAPIHCILSGGNQLGVRVTST